MPKLLENDPLSETEAILREEFYGGGSRAASTPRAKAAKPPHYKIVCISLYTKDIEHLETLVAELKKAGHTKANKSAVIRYALDNIDITKMPKSY